MILCIATWISSNLTRYFEGYYFQRLNGIIRCRTRLFLLVKGSTIERGGNKNDLGDLYSTNFLSLKKDT